MKILSGLYTPDDGAIELLFSAGAETTRTGYPSCRNGVRVEVFSIGFGPELFGWNDRAGTRWKHRDPSGGRCPGGMSTSWIQNSGSYRPVSAGRSASQEPVCPSAISTAPS